MSWFPIRNRTMPSGAVRQPWRWLTAPLAVFLLHGIALWIWHVPALFEWALAHEWVHAAQHVSFAVTAALFWWGMIALTLGLAYPWAQASLERFKVGHTFYGDLQGSFVGSGTRLFLRGVLFWILVVGPFVLGLVVVLLLRSTALSAFAARGLVLDALAFATVLYALRNGAGWGCSFGFVLGALFRAQVHLDPHGLVLGQVRAGHLHDVLAIHDGPDQARELGVSAVATLRCRAQPEPERREAQLGGERVARPRQVMALVEDHQAEAGPEMIHMQAR